MELTKTQWALLLGLVARAASEEDARVGRMTARPPGSHTQPKLEAARALAQDLAELEQAVKKEAGRDASLTSSEAHQCPTEAHLLVYQGHVAAPGYGVAYECSECGRPWLKIGAGLVDPREQVYELSPEDVR